MKIFQIHNYYKLSGGEDTVVALEEALLKSNGNLINGWYVHNDCIKSIASKINTLLKARYDFDKLNTLDRKLKTLQLDLVHVHNFFPLLTPSIYDACAKNNLPIVQTLHNFRPICANALLVRNGNVCEKCLYGHVFWSILHRCYRNSMVASVAVARMISFHLKRNTWLTKVDRFIALTEFAKEKFIIAGFPAAKIAVKPNFYSGKGVPNNGNASIRSGVLFVGRLSQEKGVRTLLKAWNLLLPTLRVAGDGPLLPEVKKKALSNVLILGGVSHDQVSQEMSNCSFLVLPSECYENFPLTLAEAFAHGLPVIASRLGAMAEIVEDGVTGLHFEPGNADDLAAKVRWMNDHPDECRQMGYNARREFEQKYTPERNYEMLMKIYQEAIDEKKQSRQS
jgi:glycosyltransferase involved in cell wall biosynthesis